jgi:hypothetical protein
MPSLSAAECLLVLVHVDGEAAFSENNAFVEATGWKHPSLFPEDPTSVLTGQASQASHIRSAREMYESLRNVGKSEFFSTVMLSYLYLTMFS